MLGLKVALYRILIQFILSLWRNRPKRRIEFGGVRMVVVYAARW